MNFDIDFINRLVSLCEDAFNSGEVPVAAAVLDSSFNIISISNNSRQNSFSVLNHAEINAIVDAENILGDWRLNGYILISTLEPCDMCSSIIKECRLDNVFYLIPRSSSSVLPNDFISKSKVKGFISQKQKLKNLLTSFFEERR